MSPDIVYMVAVLTITLLAILALQLLRHGRSRGRQDAATENTASAEASSDAAYAGIDPAEYFDAAEHRAALDRLGQLPQFCRLTDGTLIEWGSGARIATCDCSLPPVPHLMISWGPTWVLGLVTKAGLDRYLAYQERVAAGLLEGSPASPDSTGQEVH